MNPKPFHQISIEQNDAHEASEGEAALRVDSLEQQDLQPDSPPTVLNQATTVNGETKAEGGTGILYLYILHLSPAYYLRSPISSADDIYRFLSRKIYECYYLIIPVLGGVLFKGNLRGQAAKSYDKIANRLKNKFGNEYKVFLLTNPEDDKPVAVVVPSKTMQPESTHKYLELDNIQERVNLVHFDNDVVGYFPAIPEWFAAGAFGLVAKDVGIELGVPYFVPSWQIASRITGAFVVLLGLSSLFNDIAFYWVVLIFNL
ncbi:Probable zinc metalloprotease EGY2, chloroplastic [Linum grandiflorum]